MNIRSELQNRFRKILTSLTDNPDELLEMVRQSQDARFGDYQANFAMPLGKQLGRQPRGLAAEIAARLDVADFCHPCEVAGPGFINLRVRDDWLVEQLTAAINDPRLGVAEVENPRTFVIDYSAPNVAKPMHVGHIRSTVIGDAISRMLRFMGHRVISDNHIGDWGTQFGMIIYGYRHFLDAEAYRKSPVEELARVYRLVRQLMDHNAKADADDSASDPALAATAAEHADIAAAVLRETAKLHAGDAENLRLWREFLPYCLEEINRIYERLGVSFDHTLGESFYNDRLPATVEDLLRRGIAQVSDGAVCVFLEGQKSPMLVRKRDGAFLYATTDLATIRYRMETWRPDAILYVVDHRQSHHFQQLFATAGLLGYDDLELRHVSFGAVLGSDGRPFKTRAGDTVGLEGLLDEAVTRAGAIVAANDDAKPDGFELSPQRREEIAARVGIAALKYADLSQNRESDYVFSYDKMLAMNGNTATYMQYAYARVRSIFARGDVDVESLRRGVKRGQAPFVRSAQRAAAAKGACPLFIDTPAERALGLAILRFGEALDLAVLDYRPNQLTNYLFELAGCYSTFFEQCPVLKAPSNNIRQSRLLLCDLTARVIQKGLELLGIEVVEKM